MSKTSAFLKQNLLLRLVDVTRINNRTNEKNSDTIKDRSDASKNDDFPTIIVKSEIKKAIIAAGPKQPEGSQKICSKAVVCFQQIITIM